MKFINQFIVYLVKILPKLIVHIFAKRYIAGETLQDAIHVIKALNAKGIVATIDVLGEATRTKEEAEEEKKECIRVLEKIDENKLAAHLSVKPTSLGLTIDKDFCYKQIFEIVTKAKEFHTFVRLDMENSPYTDATFELHCKLRKDFDNVGVAVQSYLKRTIDDVRNLNKEHTNYRLCKGIYNEPKEIAYKDKQTIRNNYIEALKLMLDNSNYVGIATHDTYLLNTAYKLIKEKNIPETMFEFQMLYGVTDHLRDKINADGYKIRIYVPYGVHWYAYALRRMQENPEIAWFVVKSLFSFIKKRKVKSWHF
ncbi:MAG: proline dehydrogenase family protein [Candidatus Brocadiaceae bacterium]|nr:proline dehydrogenase family protein [Candidatus Brocadiaceae bacterium]